MVTLDICGVECYYGSVKVLENVRFTIGSGELVGLLGPNGSGKTTLLKAISGALRPKAGAVYLNEAEIFGMKSREVARNIAVVPQNTDVNFDFTALDIVLMGRHPHLSRFKLESEKDLTVAKNAMKLTNTWHLAERRISELSGGERQRVIIARALAQEPKVLLLDEPTTHLDINSQLEIMDLLKELCIQRGLILLTVFHDFNLAARYCDTIILLNKGKIVSIGRVDEALTSENIKKVFQVDAVVKKHPLTNSLYVIPLPLRWVKASINKRFRVHVICGAGTGAQIIKTLVEKGFDVTAGVLHVLDTDYETALLLNIPVVSEAPFSPITEQNYKANLKMISEANAVVVTSVPIGSANLLNLKAAEDALERGIPTFVVEETPITQRDFTGGEAQKLLLELKSKGATFVKSQNQLLQLLDELEVAKVR
ncbi:MAG: ABC transporter ATP-binding protein [Thaumarchaeota archaeon]|nr:ABC transporter ATP-binding protein [Nitrososphaerota archaeon]